MGRVFQRLAMVGLLLLGCARPPNNKQENHKVEDDPVTEVDGRDDDDSPGRDDTEDNGDAEDKDPGDPPPSDPWTPKWPPLQKAVAHYEIGFEDAYAPLIYDNANPEYHPGWFIVDGEKRDVFVRRRGDGARFHPKHSWKVKMPKGTPLHEGARRLNYLAEWLDAGYLSDMFSYRLMEAAGVHAPRPSYTLLTVNGQYQGIYTAVEQVDKYFLRNHDLDPDANIYRCGDRDCEMKLTPSAHYQAPWQKKTNKDEPSDDLDQLLWAISRTPEHELVSFLEKNFYLEELLRYLAANALIRNHGIDDSGTYFIHERTTGRWLVVPWDLNNAQILFRRDEHLEWGPRTHEIIPSFTLYDPRALRTYTHKEQKYGGAHPPFSTLIQRVWDNPELRGRALDYLEKMLDTFFVPEQAHSQVDQLHALIREQLPVDPWVDQERAALAPDYLKKYVTRRADYLRQEIPRERRRGEGGVVINALGSAGGAALDEAGEADPFIELYNREDEPVDLGGMTITDNARDAFRHTLPEGLVIPPNGKLVLWADGQPEQGPRHLPFRLGDDGGELAVFDGVSRIGVVDVTFYAPLGNGRTYARIPDGAESWGWRE